MANPLFKLVSNASAAKSANNAGIISTSAKLQGANDIGSIFQKNLEQLAQNNGITSNISVKDILEALTNAASNGKSGEGFSYSINNADGTEVVDSSEKDPGKIKGSKEDKIEKDKKTAANNSNATVLKDSNSPNKYITGPFEVIKTDISKLKDSEIDFTKIYEDTAEPNESELTKEDNPNAVGIGLDGNNESITESISIDNPEGEDAANNAKKSNTGNNNVNNLISLLSQLFKTFLKQN